MNTQEFTITKKRFLDWYFEEDFTAESLRIRTELAERVILGLEKDNTFTITTQDIFNEANKDAIRGYFLEEFAYDTENYDIELSDLAEDFNLTLID